MVDWSKAYPHADNMALYDTQASGASAHPMTMKRNKLLKQTRLECGLSKTQAARRLNVSDRSYSRWESGERAVTMGVTDRLKKAPD